MTYYRCVATDTLEGAAAKSYSAVAEIFVIGEGEEHIEVSFRLISSTFTVKHGSTVRDLFQQAVDAAVLMYKGPDSSYISSITAMNWPNSPTAHVYYQRETSFQFHHQSGDIVIFHYVDDYRYEDENTNINLDLAQYLNNWLQASDKNPAMSDDAAADQVIEQINALPTEITLDNKAAVEAARAAYGDLTDAQKALVPADTLKKLTDAEAAIKELEEESSKEFPFVDVNEGQWFYSDVACAHAKGIMNGIETTVFGPDESLTRCQFISILGRYAGIEDSSAEAPGESTFGDVPTSMYYASHVAWGVEQGIIKGMTKTEFSPNEKITREQMATMMYRYAEAMEIALPETDGSTFSDDTKIGDYAKETVYRMKAAGILDGMGDGTFAPQAQAAKVIHIFMEFEPEEN